MDQAYARSEPVLLPFYPRLIYLALLDKGFEERQLFDGLDFSAEHLHDENYRLSVAQHETFILRALEITGDPHLAIELARSGDMTSSNLALLAIANSGQIAKALHLIMRYNRILTRTISIQSIELDDDVVMVIEPKLEHDSVIYFALSCFILFLGNFFRAPLGGAPLLRRAELSVPEPAGFDTVRSAFGVPISFGHAITRVFFNGEHLDKPMRQADPQTVRLLMEMSERQLKDAEAEVTFAGAVRSLLIERIASPPSLEEAAKLLGVSSRGLRRKLSQSNTTYQKLLDSVRSSMATRLLKESSAPVSSIAYELGYDNASDFSRAFKKWVGVSPSSIRSSAR